MKRTYTKPVELYRYGWPPMAMCMTAQGTKVVRKAEQRKLTLDDDRIVRSKHAKNIVN